MTYVGPYTQATLLYQPDDMVNVTTISTPGTLLNCFRQFFPNFAKLVETAGLAAFYNDDGGTSYTVFVPRSDVDFPTFDRNTCCRICKSSTISGRITTGVLSSSRLLVLDTRSEANPLEVKTTSSNEIVVGGCLLLYGDIFCANGVVHVIDDVIWPNY